MQSMCRLPSLNNYILMRSLFTSFVFQTQFLGQDVIFQITLYVSMRKSLNSLTFVTLEGNLLVSHMIDWCIQTLWKVYLSKIELWNCTIIKRLEFLSTTAQLAKDLSTFFYRSLWTSLWVSTSKNVILRRFFRYNSFENIIVSSSCK